ncbi:hypothetical protein KVR01_013034 [Diaporthe batatas]|uniref:uncharacterized protein n=1 Tax=Diaporthe batatas TaxID=748121 RepID=UPI001D042A34|nr:uncharacterized protein KVR01_013034 [Diaporthe batatas]KAG8157044.1 hypothetical protein KVR01_013034 [Diaporthe batatas]
MIATRPVERSRSALHKSSQLQLQLQLHSRLHSRLLNLNHNHANRDPAVYRPRLFQKRCAHINTSVPFGWTRLNENEEEPKPDRPLPKAVPRDNDFVKSDKQARQKRFRLARRPTTTGSVHATGPLLPSSGSPGTIPYYHVALKALLNALRQGDTFRLYLALMGLVRGHETAGGSEAFTQVVATIPATTFSEILRNLDPHRVAEEVDTAPGINITYGTAVYTPLGELVNQWGVKTLYVRILRRLLHIQLARRSAGLVPLMNDYVVLIRCAGAASNIRAAKDLWHAMVGDGRVTIRHSTAYSEFLRARYLAENIYANNDLNRFRLRPLDMHRSSLRLRPHSVLRLKNIMSSIRGRRKHRFGSNMHERFYDEPLTRVLRKRDPLNKLERAVVLRGMSNNEDVVCALVKANGRVGRLAATRGLLKAKWGLAIGKDPATGAISIEGGHTYPPDSPRRPTAALLDAVVHGYGCAGEITTAVRLVDYISQHFSIPVPDRVWSDLIDYTRIMQTRPASTEWAIANLATKGARRQHVMEIWKLCTQEPYSFQPGAADYYNLIKSLIDRGQPVLHAVEALRQIKPLYDEAVGACEQAWCELVQTTAQGVPNHGAFRRYKLLQARRSHVWFMFQYSIHLILKGLRPGRIDDESAVRAVPKLIGDFAPFIPSGGVSYRIATGLVEFNTGASIQGPKVKVSQLLAEPMWPTKHDRLSTPKVEMGGGVDKDGHAEGTGASEKSEDAEQDMPVSYDEQSPGYRPPTGRRRDKWEVEKPAYMFRPRFSGPADQQTILSLRRDGGEFTGYHDDPARRRFAAYRVIRTTSRVGAVPVDLDWAGGPGGGHKSRRTKMVEEVMRMRT